METKDPVRLFRKDHQRKGGGEGTEKRAREENGSLIPDKRRKTKKVNLCRGGTRSRGRDRVNEGRSPNRGMGDDPRDQKDVFPTSTRKKGVCEINKRDWHAAQEKEACHVSKKSVEAAHPLSRVVSGMNRRTFLSKGGGEENQFYQYRSQGAREQAKEGFI